MRSPRKPRSGREPRTPRSPRPARGPRDKTPDPAAVLPPHRYALPATPTTRP